jgi:hypothetical protein
MNQSVRHRLGRRAQLGVGPIDGECLDVGIMATNPDPADPAARIRISHRRLGVSRHIVRPGESVRAGSWTLTFTEIVHGDGDGHIVFDAVQDADTGTDAAPGTEESPA